MSGVWRVPLPRGAEPPYYLVAAGELRFSRPLEKEKIGVGRWTAMFFGLFGSYGKNDTVDLQYRLAGRDVSATDLRIIPPD